MAFFCGSRSFSHPGYDDPWQPSTPRISRRKQGGNPYSTRGLDRFSMLLADLESRREKVIAAAGSPGAAIVQFVYSNTDDWVPIVVRHREPRPAADNPRKAAASGGGGGAQVESRSASPEKKQAPPAAEQAEVAPAGRAAKKSLSWKARDGEGGGGWRPSCYLPVAVALVLLCLAVFGRTFAICCTSIWWYCLPSAAGKCSGDVRKSTKKEYRRKTSDKRLGGAAAVGGGDTAAPPALGRKSGGLEGLASPRNAGGKRGSW